MKNLKTLTLLSFLLSSCATQTSPEKQYKYMIVDSRGCHFFTHVYVVDDGCVIFKDSDMYDQTICGNFRIEELKKTN